MADERPLLVDLEVRDARIDDEPVRRTSRVEHAPRGRSVEAGVGRPAGGLIAGRDHGGVGDEVRHPGRGLERQVRIDDRRPRRQGKQPIAIHARLRHQVTQDRQCEVSLELVILGVGQDRDPDL